MRQIFSVWTVSNKMIGLLLCLIFVTIFHKSISVTTEVYPATSEERSIILNQHNELRSKVANGNQPPQPKASNMKEMMWEEGLAKEAETLAKKCKFAHNDTGTGCYKHVGTNLYYTSMETPSQQYREAITTWFSEVKDFPPEYVPDYIYDPRTKHYSQLVWATTFHIGCARCLRMSGNTVQSQEIICIYGPPGINEHHSVYEIGEACSQCARNCSTTYTGLCIIEDICPYK